MLTHDHFEQLCAAAVTGQITHDELVALQEHMERCANCRDFVGDVGQVLGPAVAECAHKHFPAKAPKGATERFIAKAHSEGIPLGKVAPQRRWPTHQTLGMVAVAAFIALMSVILYPKFLAEHRGPPDETSKVIQSPTFEGGEAAALRLESAKLKEQLENFKAQNRIVALKLASSEEARSLADGRIVEIGSKLSALENANGDLRNRLQDRDAQVTQLSGSLNRLNALKEANEIAVQAEESELNSLRKKVELLTSEIQESEQLSRAAIQAKDLIVARNLHIVDVKEADEHGNQQKPFGRIFFAEGKKLVFYAYDLADGRELNAKFNFYVWGERLGASKPIKTLGVFRNDNKNEGRWVLTFDDPQVLAEIDSVFVTAESDKQPVKGPRGRRILYAFLGGKPNHP